MGAACCASGSRDTTYTHCASESKADESLSTSAVTVAASTTGSATALRDMTAAPVVSPSPNLSIIEKERGKFTAAHEISGYTVEGVAAYSNGHSNRFDNEQHYLNGIFMGYKWQCVEFARRWLWLTKGLLLPQRRTAYGFEGIEYVRKPAERREDGNYEEVHFVKVPCHYVKRGALKPPKDGSLIIYPMSCGSPWGHIGVITKVDCDEGIVYVADQNRFFRSWGDTNHSAAFKLECLKGKYYIRDLESECKGWIEFDC